MGGNYQVPIKDARAVFTAAEDYEQAMDVLTSQATTNHRLVVPQLTTAAMAIEYYLKCLIVDSGSKTIPAKHDLRVLFMNLPTKTRQEIQKTWDIMRNFIAQGGGNLDGVPAEIITPLTESANAFDAWRYRFESTANLPMLNPCLPMVVGALHAFIMKRHPSWRDGGAHFQSTFPVQKIPTPNASLSPQAFGSPISAPHYRVPNQQKELCSPVVLPGLPRTLSTL